MDRLETEWHLTPSGWKKGTTRFFGSPQGGVVDAPPDRVLTLIYEIYQRSEWSNEEQHVHEAWRAANADGSIAELRERYPEPFSAD